MGAEQSVDWEKRASALDTVRELRRDRRQIVVLEQTPKSISYHKIKPKKDFVLVLGNEVKGVGRAVLREAQRIVDIPMSGKKESLNVSVAFGIAVYGLKYRK